MKRGWLIDVLGVVVGVVYCVALVVTTVRYPSSPIWVEWVCDVPLFAGALIMPFACASSLFFRRKTS